MYVILQISCPSCQGVGTIHGLPLTPFHSCRTAHWAVSWQKMNSTKEQLIFCLFNTRPHIPKCFLQLVVLIPPLICATSPIEMVKNSYRKNLRENSHCYRDLIPSTLLKKVVLSLLRMNRDFARLEFSK